MFTFSDDIFFHECLIQWEVCTNTLYNIHGLNVELKHIVPLIPLKLYRITFMLNNNWTIKKLTGPYYIEIVYYHSYLNIMFTRHNIEIFQFMILFANDHLEIFNIEMKYLAVNYFTVYCNKHGPIEKVLLYSFSGFL